MKPTYTLLFVFCIAILSCEKKEAKWESKTLGFQENFHDIEAIDSNTLIAYTYGSGLVVKSEDQGHTWREVFKTDSIYYEQIEFPTSKMGFICGNSNKILKTIDGGNNWIEILIDSISETAPVYGMKFLNKEVGYLSVINRNQKGFESIIYKTENSGDTWQNINTIPEMLLNIEIIENEVWASGNHVVLKNIDQKNWKTVYKDSNQKVGQIRSFVVKKNQIIMASFNGYIIRKHDNIISTDLITSNRLRSVIRINDDVLFAAGDNNKEKGNLFESNDNGESWKVLDKKFSDIHRLIKVYGIVWGIGKEDEIIKYY